MSRYFRYFFLLCITPIFAQTNTEIYVMNLNFMDDSFKVTNFKNASENPGYDSQPSFYDNNSILYAGTRNKATDIVLTSIHQISKTYAFQTTEGGEYSPQIIPGSGNVAAVRLDKDGKQRLYEYSSGKQNSSEMIANLQVAYFAFYTKDILLASVLSDDNLDLAFIDLTSKTVDTILGNSGRSIHKIPKKDAMSYTAVNEEGNLDVFQLDMMNKESYFICQLPIGIQDHAWLNSSQLIIGSNHKLYVYDTFGGSEWEEIADLSEFKIENISRLAVSPDGKTLALVAEPKPE